MFSKMIHKDQVWVMKVLHEFSASQQDRDILNSPHLTLQDLAH